TLSATIAAAGSPLTLTGIGFDPNPSHDVVRINGSIAVLTAASATSLTVSVPPLTGAGAVSVTTPSGTTTGPDLFIPPDPYTVAQVGTVGRIPVNHQQTVSVSSAGKIAILAFDGLQDQRLSLTLANATL